MRRQQDSFLDRMEAVGLYSEHCRLLCLLVRPFLVICILIFLITDITSFMCLLVVCAFPLGDLSSSPPTFQWVRVFAVKL